jgi:pyruvyltransferase
MACGVSCRIQYVKDHRLAIPVSTSNQLQPEMLSKTKTFLSDRFTEIKCLVTDQVALSNSACKLPIRFYNSVPNVGDQLNLYILKHVSQRVPYEVQSSLTPHILAIGSIAHLAGRGSYLWGCGMIDNTPSPLWRRISQSRILALRGSLTFNEFERRGYTLNNLPLGDPAIFTSRYYTPSAGSRACRVGIIPHYIHHHIISPKVANDNNVKLIGVQTDPEKFIDSLLSCEYILSSSLHGLILADTFEIPNKWIKIKPDLFGGDFKFHDYYSTTDHPDEKPEQYDPLACLSSFCRSMIKETSVKSFTLSKEALLDSFPYSV